MNAILTEKHFYDEPAAYAYVESHIWPHGPVCPHCGSINEGHYRLQGKTTRPGLWKCRDCREPFTVKIGTIFEKSHVPMHIWLQAIFLISSSKKGISSHQLQRTLGVTIKTAWFLSHRIREAMKDGGIVFSNGGSTVEADATYVGGKESNKHRSKRSKKNIGGVGKECVFTLVERETGKAHSFQIPTVNAKTLHPILNAQLATAKTHLMTDGEGQFRVLAPMFASHGVVNHEAGEYVRGAIHTNTVEGFFSILKRGIVGTYHHVSPKHLARYCAEFDFRYNNRETKVKVNGKWEKAGLNDTERAAAILAGAKGKRLTYQQPHIG
jgi:transposase-like protein